jgi:hypothetical protein
MRMTLDQFYGDLEFRHRLEAAARQHRARALGEFFARIFKGRTKERRHAARTHLARQG